LGIFLTWTVAIMWLLEQVRNFYFWLAFSQPGSRPASFASAADRGQPALLAETANLWRTNRKPLLLFQLLSG
jgi:hypothetical protein